MKKILPIVFICGIIANTSTLAQNWSPMPKYDQDSAINYIEVSGMAASDSRTPFWMQVNQYGTIPRTGTAGTVRGQLEVYRALGKRSDWRVGMGIEAVANLAQDAQLLFPQTYVSLRYKDFEFLVGSKKQQVGLADSTMGMGSYAWSGNAIPLPRIQVGTSRYIPLPFSAGWLSFQAFYSEGFFEKSRNTTSELRLHQKMLYVRLGQNDSRIKLYAGMNHQVQWGGKSPYETVDGVMSKGWQNYLRLVTGRPGAVGKDTVSYFDDSNRVGNHLGTIDVAMEFETHGFNLFMYRQSIYEDGTLYTLGNIADGLHGLRIRRKNDYGSGFSISEVVLEYLYTKSQGGPINDPSRPDFKRGVLGRDNYFNNAQVRDGWSYFDRTIGTPFITPTSDTEWKYPKYADFFTSNNRVCAFHLGVKGLAFHKIQFVGKFSWSSNIGTYDAPFATEANQFSGYLGLQTKIRWFRGATLKGALAADLGDLYRPSCGVSLGLRKDFDF